jgi:superfamily II DNA or RNA helicase
MLDLKDYSKFYHVDLSTQIGNKWKSDTVLAIVKFSRKYSLKIRGKDKEKIKKRFISNEKSRSAKKHNRRVIAAIYSYLLYSALCDFKEAKPLLLCRDVRPERDILRYFQKIAHHFKNKSILNRDIRFRKKIEFDTKVINYFIRILRIWFERKR